ncbi:MAG: DUF3597 domain-containing protein [Janthinobacterium lividum]
MSIFGSIMSAIFGASPAAAAAPASAGSPAAADAATTTPDAPAAQAAAPAVDVSEVLTAKAAQAGQTLDWRHSIVDLMKLLGLDSSLAARKELAGELHYTGDTNDSASMNVWLHSAVMQKLAENGGKVPDDLKG